MWGEEAVQHAGWMAKAWAARWAASTGMELCGQAEAVTEVAGKKKETKRRQGLLGMKTKVSYISFGIRCKRIQLQLGINEKTWNGFYSCAWSDRRFICYSPYHFHLLSCLTAHLSEAVLVSSQSPESPIGLRGDSNH